MRLKWDNEGIKSPLARARGYGSAHEGSGHWLQQRATAVSNLFLMLWLMWTVVHARGFDYAQITAFLQNPFNAILMILAAISFCWHAQLGTQVVVEDYVHAEGRKIALLLALRFFFAAAAIAMIFSVAKICFGG
jgi:succinate dehydrogenase / fumarate reductase membrane anchor subunit